MKSIPKFITDPKDRPSDIKEREQEFIRQAAILNIISDAKFSKDGVNIIATAHIILNQNQLQEFISYWTEINPNGRKMRFEKEKTFDITRRLQRWARNAEKWDNNSVKKRFNIDQL